MNNPPRTKRNCLACDHPELMVGLVGTGHGASARLIALLDRAAIRGFWKGATYKSQSLVCPNCGHVETVLQPEELAALQVKLGLDMKKSS